MGGDDARIFIGGFNGTPSGIPGVSDLNMYIDDFKVREIGTFPGSDDPENEGTVMIGDLSLTPDIDKDINLPSYAQKALLDYVRGINAYEQGDVKTWDFFMKQFRSKLERWEDSRIPGPRILGTGSQAIR